MANNNERTTLIGVLYLIYSILIFLGFGAVFAAWEFFKEDLFYSLISIENIFDKTMFVEILKYITPIAQTGLIIALAMNLMSILIIQQRKIAPIIAEILNNAMIVFLTAITVIGIMNVNALLGPAKYHIAEFDNFIFNLRLLIGMIGSLIIMVSVFINNKISSLTENIDK